jgi:hypothetical protein
MKLGPTAGSAISMRCIGQSVGSRTELRNELSALLNAAAPSSALSIQSLSFLDAVNHFSGGLNYQSVFMKAKSDYVLSPLSHTAITALLTAVAQAPVGGIAVLCDAYGGAIADPAATDTAFPRRAGTQCVLHSIFFQLVGPG